MVEGSVEGQTRVDNIRMDRQTASRRRRKTPPIAPQQMTFSPAQNRRPLFVGVLELFHPLSFGVAASVLLFVVVAVVVGVAVGLVAVDTLLLFLCLTTQQPLSQSLATQTTKGRDRKASLFPTTPHRLPLLHRTHSSSLPLIHFIPQATTDASNHGQSTLCLRPHRRRRSKR